VRILINGGVGSRPKSASGEGISEISKKSGGASQNMWDAGNILVAYKIGI